MWAKEEGFVLSIDQASNCAGVSLWHNGQLVAWTDLQASRKKDPMPIRLREQLIQLRMFLETHNVDTVSAVLFEKVRAEFVSMICGAYLTMNAIKCHIGKDHLIHTNRWKGWARSQGAGKTVHRSEIKGVQALKEIGWDFNAYPIESDDVADSVLMYLAWRS